MTRRLALRRLTIALGAAFLAAWPGLASACPYCAAANGKASAAYLWTAVGLGSIPILFGGGLALWLRARYRKPAPRVEDERDAAGKAA